MFRIHESELSTFSNSSEIYIDSKGTKVKYKLHFGQSMGSLFRATTRLESQDYTDVYNRLHGYWRSMRSQTALKIWSKRKTPVEPRSAKQQTETQIANSIGPTLHIDWVIGIWLRSHVHDWANVGVVLHSHAIFADVGPTLANDLLLQRIMKVIFFHRNNIC